MECITNHGKGKVIPASVRKAFEGFQSLQPKHNGALCQFLAS
jgi:hypothetical protein